MVHVKGNRTVADRHKNRVVLKYILVTIGLIVFQISLFTVNDDVLYWDLYDTSSDFIELFLAIAVFASVSYTAVRLKMVTGCVTIWFMYSSVSQVITDYIQAPIDDMLGGIFTAVLIIVVFLARFLFTWSPDKTETDLGCFYEVIGKPTNLSQLVVAMYSGRGGAFGITDGVHLWHYSKPHNSMVCEKLGFGYVKGRMIKKICITSKEKYNELDAMTGQRFTLMHNCLQLHALSGRWL